MKVFLGGTCNGSQWREKLITMLEVGYFNPVVADWDEEAYKNELREREDCDFCLYVITPRMTGVYAIAEVVDDSNKRPEKTLFCFLTTDPNGAATFSDGQAKSLQRVGQMVADNGGSWFTTLEDVALYLNLS